MKFKFRIFRQNTTVSHWFDWMPLWFDEKNRDFYLFPKKANLWRKTIKSWIHRTTVSILFRPELNWWLVGTRTSTSLLGPLRGQMDTSLVSTHPTFLVWIRDCKMIEWIWPRILTWPSIRIDFWSFLEQRRNCLRTCAKSWTWASNPGSNWHWSISTFSLSCWSTSCHTCPSSGGQRWEWWWDHKAIWSTIHDHPEWI